MDNPITKDIIAEQVKDGLVNKTIDCAIYSRKSSRISHLKGVANSRGLYLHAQSQE